MREAGSVCYIGFYNPSTLTLGSSEIQTHQSPLSMAKASWIETLGSFCAALARTSHDL